jgi:CHAT domain-containing protein/Tfp pilus assembly protein PilF
VVRALALLLSVAGCGRRPVDSLEAKLDALLAQGDHQAAIPVALEVLAEKERALGPDHPDVAMCLNNLAFVYHAQGRYAEAESLLNRVMAITEKALGPDHPDSATCLNNLAMLYQDQGRYADAEPLFSRALAIWEKALGPDHPDVATCLNNLAALYQDQGRYAEAEQPLNRSLAIKEKALGPDHPGVAMCLNNLAFVHQTQGRCADAEPLFSRALAVWEKALGPDHPDVATCLNNLAALYQDQARYADAEPLFSRALAIWEKALGPDHPDVATCLNNLAALYQDQGRCADAEPLFSRALAIWEKALGPDHPDVATCLNNLAALYQNQGLYAEAEPLYTRALEIMEKAFGPDHPHLAKVLTHETLIHSIQGRVEALDEAVRAFGVEADVSAENFSMLSERQRMDFSKMRGDYPFQIACSLALRHTQTTTQAVQAACLMHLRSKGRVLDSVLEDRQSLAGNPEAEKVFTSLRETKRRLANLQFQPLDKLTENDLAKVRQEMGALGEEKDALEQKLARMAGRYREGRRAAKVTVEEVRQALRSGEALVDFTVFSPIATVQDIEDGLATHASPLLPTQYAAFILTREAEPLIVSLGDAEGIDEAISTFRRKLAQGEDAGDEMRTLYRMVWAPLAESIAAKERFLISPDGQLNFLAFAALRGPEGKYLIERHTLGYVTSGRDLVRRLDSAAAVGPTLFGDPAFGDALPDPAPDSTDYLARATAYRSVLADRDRSLYGNLSFPRLPGTLDELNDLKVLLKDAKTQTFTGAEAREERLKTLRQPAILHLATHGFFLDDIEPAAPAGMSGVPAFEAGLGPVHRGNPMHRSGLALAGASLAALGRQKDGVLDDGIVTAEEVGGLDLWGTKLVVLSACDTGRGEAQAGEGVMGLRRAFVQAGARNLLLTLWRVEDRTTRELMVRFYQDFVETGDAVGAMTRAQRHFLSTAQPSAQPRFWAPFLVSIQGGTVAPTAP